MLCRVAGLLPLNIVIRVIVEMNMTNMIQLQIVICIVKETWTKPVGDLGQCLCHTLQTVSRNNVMLVAFKILNLKVIMWIFFRLATWLYLTIYFNLFLLNQSWQGIHKRQKLFNNCLHTLFAHIQRLPISPAPPTHTWSHILHCI